MLIWHEQDVDQNGNYVICYLLLLVVGASAFNWWDKHAIRLVLKFNTN